MDKTIRTAEAAVLLRCSYKTVIDYCRRGKLKGQKNPITGSWLIDLGSVNDLLASVQTGSAIQNESPVR
jgi:hypothetical protein